MKRTIILLAGLLFILANYAEGNVPKSVIMGKMIENSELNTPLLDISAEPSSIIGGAVNVITGNYVETERDLVIPGSNPLIIQRNFNSGSKGRGTLCHGWDLNFPSNITVYYDDTLGAKDPVSAIVNDRGASLLFQGHTNRGLKLDRKQLQYGVTNCSAGILNSRTNIKNKKLSYSRYGAKHCELKEESGENLLYKCISSSRGKRLRYTVNKNLLPTGCSFAYEYDEKDRLLRVISKGQNENFISRIKWIYPRYFKETPELTLLSSDDRKICYKYKKQQSHDPDGNNRYCLTSVLRDHAPEVSYDYRYVSKHTMERMTRKSLPDNRYLNIQYYEQGNNKVGSDQIYISSEKDSSVGRVAALYAPVGVDSSPIMTWGIKYHLQRRHKSSKPIGGYAEVIDALGHRKVYHFSDEQRLTSVEHFFDNGHLYRNEQMVWEEHGEEKTFLLARGYTDGAGSLLLRRDYGYDKHGNVLQETLSGNLTGCGDDSVKWTVVGAQKDAEQYIKTYTYTDTGLVASENDGRKKTEYQYVAGTNLVSLKLVSDNNGIRERNHYVYDSNSTLVEEIEDDGNTWDINNLSGVTERRIKRIKPKTSYPIGLPKVIEERFLNLSTGQEVLLTRAENTYSKEGYLRIQKIYDNQNNYCYSKKWDYDLRGNVIQEIDPLGQITTYKYDQNNNRIYQQTPNHKFHTLYFYDCANRLIREEKINNEGEEHPHLIQTYAYDYMGNRIASTDKYKNTTTFAYDEFGRLIKTILPSIVNAHGELEQPIESVSYDCMNNPCMKMNTNGYKTTIKYTAWGKPYQIENPDNSKELSVYHLDGTLERMINTKGVETFYSYDYKGRKIKEEKISPAGKSLSTHQWIYSSFHLIEEIDPAGYKTIYTYDGAGRQENVKKGDSETKYVYDSLGRQSEIWELYEPGKYRRTVSEYDYLDRVVHEKVMDESDTIFTKKTYEYDVDSNRKLVIIHDNLCDSCTLTEFNSDKKPIKIVQPDGSQTLFEYIYDFQNGHGQTVAFEKEIDPKGNQTIRIMDACGRLAKEEKKDSSGNLLQSTSYRHEGEGNLVSRTDDVLVEGVLQNKIVTEFFYDYKNRETSCIEAAGDVLQKTTQKTYHPSGELATIIKPDGIILFHEYDYLSRLIDMHSSDGSVHYTYKYDLNSNLREVEDLVHGTKTLRNIDENSRMISETLGTKLQFIYEYDSRGRVKQLTLPDQSTVRYSYNAANLHAISRSNNRGRLTCNYHYNLSGRIAKLEMPNDLGNINYTYDQCLRTRSIESKKWSQTIPEGGYDSCGNLIKTSQKDVVGDLTSTYTYDALHHLVAETGTAEHSYRFDSLHNRIRKNNSIHTVNKLNQLTQQGEMSYKYDLNGNHSKKISSGKESIYQYDALDRLIAVTRENQRTEYLYDSFHRRLKKTTFVKQAGYWIETDACTFLYQGDKEIGALDKWGQVIEMRTLGLGHNEEIGAAVLLEIKDLTLMPLHDFRGNVVSLVDINDGNLIECYRYSAYGEEQIFDSSGNRQNMALCPWRFSSKRVDLETGWTFFGRRYYDSEIGKWTTPDPLRFKDSLNVYCFVRNRPMKYLDPDGRSIATTIGDNYEIWANFVVANCMKEYAGVEWDAHETPNYFYYSTKYRVGTPQNDGRYMSFVNGILTSKEESIAAATMYSNMAGGREVFGVHNATYGLMDLVECGLGLFGIMTTPSKLVQENWSECLSNSNNCILHLAHSQGMIHTKNTIPSYDKELRQRIEILAVAPAAHVKSGDFGDAMHYHSLRDFVPLLEDLVLSTSVKHLIGIENRAPVVMLRPHPDAPLFDHFIDSPTYQQPVQMRVEKFFNN